VKSQPTQHQSKTTTMIMIIHH